MKTTKQIKFSIIFIVLAMAFAAGCNKNDSVLGPNGQNNQVSFQITQQSGLNGGTEFLFNPSVDVRISRIISQLPAQNFADTISFAYTNYVYSKDTVYIVGEYSGVQQGQQWKFNFTGTLPGQNNPSYNVTTNYTAQ